MKLLGQDRDTEIARLYTRGDADLEHFHDLLHGRAELQGRLNMPHFVAAASGGVMQ